MTKPLPHCGVCGEPLARRSYMLVALDDGDVRFGFHGTSINQDGCVTKVPVIFEGRHPLGLFREDLRRIAHQFPKAVQLTKQGKRWLAGGKPE